MRRSKRYAWSGLRSVEPVAVLCLVVVLFSPARCPAQLARSWNTDTGDWSIDSNWSPIGVPQSNDGAFIGNLPVAANGFVALYQDDSVAGVQVSHGATLQVAGSHKLTVQGDTTVSDAVLRLDGTFSPNIVNYETNNLTITDGAVIWMRLSGVLQVDTKFTIDESSVLGKDTADYDNGFVRLTGTGEVLQNDGLIAPDGSITIDVTAGGRLDLDGDLGGGSILLSTGEQLTINGGVLNDSFSASIDIGENGNLTMNVDEPWLADSSSQIRFPNNTLAQLDYASLNGADVTVGGNFLVGDNAGFIVAQLNANATFVSGANLTIFQGDLLETTGETVVEGGNFLIQDSGELEMNGRSTIGGGSFTIDANGRIDMNDEALVEGGTFTIAENGAVDFNGPTTIQGGTFISLTDNPGFDTSVALEGETLYTGDVTFTGNTRQLGDARVGLSSVINAEVFDMDGADAVSPTTWDINAATIINATRIEGGIGSNPSFDGTINVSGSIVNRLTINLSDPSEAWMMGGTMNLTGNVLFYVTRLAGSPVNVTGDLNASSRVVIAANASFASSSTVDFAGATTILRMTGRTTVEAAATFTGQGILENGVGGTMSLAAGLATGQVGVTNRGRLELGETVGVISVDRFENVTDATLVVDVGRNTIGTNSDVLTVSSGAADVAGFVQPNIVNIGGVFQPPMVGDSFTILTAVGGVNNMFDAVLNSNLGGQVYEWSIIHNPSNVVIQLADVSGLLGDYNQNGVVDAPDYALWRDTLGEDSLLAADGNQDGVVNQADYDVWRTHFGETAGSGASATGFINAAIPEPTSFALLLLATAIGMHRRATISPGLCWFACSTRR